MPTPAADRDDIPLRVSVAMCTYNGETFLRQQLESIRRQTVLPHEMVVCDDGSSDATFAILEGFALSATFPVRIFRNLETLGPAQNFAQCIARCDGDIIILTDQDDLWFADRVANTEQAFRASPRLTFVFSECPLIDAHGRDLGRSIYSTLPISAADRKLLLEGSALLPVLMRRGILYGTTMAFRANLRTLILPVPGLWSHDEWVGLVLSAVGPSARLRTPVTRYRQHAAQQVGTGDWTLKTHLELAKKHSARHYETELLRFEYAIAAIQPHRALHESLLSLLKKKLAFLRDRRSIQSGGIGKLFLFVQLFASGAYGRFGSAAKSPLKDLLMSLGLFRKQTSLQGE